MATLEAIDLPYPVIPAKAGIQGRAPAGVRASRGLDTGLRRCDEGGATSSYRRRPVSSGLAMLLTSLLAACAAPGEKLGPFDASCQAGAAVVAGQPSQLTCGPPQSVARLVNGGVAYPLLDVLAPNWEARHEALGTDRVRIAMRKTGFVGGREGEAAQLFAQRAGQIAAATGHSGFTILEYTEGIEATFPLAQRVVQGVVRLNR